MEHKRAKAEEENQRSIMKSLQLLLQQSLNEMSMNGGENVNNACHQKIDNIDHMNSANVCNQNVNDLNNVIIDNLLSNGNDLMVCCCGCFYRLFVYVVILCAFVCINIQNIHTMMKTLNNMNGAPCTNQVDNSSSNNNNNIKPMFNVNAPGLKEALLKIQNDQILQNSNCPNSNSFHANLPSL